MPQLDFTYLFSQIFWLSFSFGLFFFCVKCFIVPKLESIVLARTSIKQDSAGAVKDLELEIASMKASSKAKSDEMNAFIKRLKSESESKFDEYSKKLLSEMQNKTDEELSAASKEIEAFKVQFSSSEEIKTIVSSCAQKIIHKIAAVNVNDTELKAVK